MKAFGLQDSKDLCSSDPKQHSAVGQSVPPLFPGCVPPVDPPCCRPPLCLCAFLQPSNPRKAGECLQSHMLCHNHPAYRVTAAVESGVSCLHCVGDANFQRRGETGDGRCSPSGAFSSTVTRKKWPEGDRISGTKGNRRSMTWRPRSPPAQAALTWQPVAS
mmetsp:Transcript_14112/g.39990  ORF Transcript_14112/g.39990 Transcript_14112/m.39990 type:complete len:161 (-) Transcript_14112:538-1020(-)